MYIAHLDIIFCDIIFCINILQFFCCFFFCVFLTAYKSSLYILVYVKNFLSRSGQVQLISTFKKILLYKIKKISFIVLLSWVDFTIKQSLLPSQQTSRIAKEGISITLLSLNKVHKYLWAQIGLLMGRYWQLTCSDCWDTHRDPRDIAPVVGMVFIPLRLFHKY